MYPIQTQADDKSVIGKVPFAQINFSSFAVYQAVAGYPDDLYETVDSRIFVEEPDTDTSTGFKLIAKQ